MMKVNKKIEFKDTGKLVKLDGKRRITLGSAVIVPEAGISFKVLQNELGQVLLDPVKMISAYEAWVYEDPTHIESIKRGVAQAEARDVTRVKFSSRKK